MNRRYNRTMNTRIFVLLALLVLVGLACDKVVREARVPAATGDSQAALVEATRK